MTDETQAAYSKKIAHEELYVPRNSNKTQFLKVFDKQINNIYCIQHTSPHLLGRENSSPFKIRQIYWVFYLKAKNIYHIISENAKCFKQTLYRKSRNTFCVQLFRNSIFM